MTDHLRVLSFESRKADEMRSLIERQNGEPTIAAALKEVPLGITPEIRDFVEHLRRGVFDLVIFMTGVGAEALAAAVETEFARDDFLNWLRQTRIVVRGPKPATTLKKWSVPFAARADEPNTWHEVVAAVLKTVGSEAALPLAGLTIGVQEYGQPSTELYAELVRLGATVQPVSVYRWSLPDDIEPLKAALIATTQDAFDVVLFTTAQQLVHAADVAESLGIKDAWLKAVSRCVVASIGPTASERLREYGLPVDLEPQHPHMAHLVRETLERAGDLLPDCRRR